MKQVRDFVYVAAKPSGLHKVGYTLYPDRRENGLRGLFGRDVAIIYVALRNGDGRDVERAVHGMLSPKWVHGEWFRTDAQEAIERMNDACEMMDRQSAQRVRIEQRDRVERQLGRDLTTAEIWSKRRTGSYWLAWPSESAR